MIVIWRGAGGVVLLIPIIACVVMNIATAKAFDETHYFQQNLWPKVVALWVSGLVCWIVGRYANGQPDQILINETTGEEVRERPYHHLMFIKIEYWGIIFLVIGLVLIVIHLSG